MNIVNFLVSMFFIFTLPIKLFSYELEKFIVKSDGFDLTVWHKGETSKNSKKDPIILLHGLTWSALPAFDLQVANENVSVMDSLSKMGYSVWAIDLRGYGSTPRDSTQLNNLSKASKDLFNIAQWIREREGKKPISLGWSNGAIVNHLTAELYPDFAKAIILLAFPTKVMKQGDVNRLIDKPIYKKNTETDAKSDFIEGSIPQSIINEFVTQSLKTNPIKVDWSDSYNIKRFHPENVLLPVLLIEGEADPTTDFLTTSNSFNKFKNGLKQWVILPRAHHAPMFEKSHNQFISSIISFINLIDL